MRDQTYQRKKASATVRLCFFVSFVSFSCGVCAVRCGVFLEYGLSLGHFFVQFQNCQKRSSPRRRAETWRRHGFVRPVLLV